MKKTSQAEPPRPRCSKCGKPGVYFVTLEVKEMTLAREAGMSSRPYWRSDYHSGTKLETILCDGCHDNNISISAAVTATLPNAKEKP